MLHKGNGNRHNSRAAFGSSKSTAPNNRLEATHNGSESTSAATANSSNFAVGSNGRNQTHRTCHFWVLASFPSPVFAARYPQSRKRCFFGKTEFEIFFASFSSLVLKFRPPNGENEILDMSFF